MTTRKLSNGQKRRLNQRIEKSVQEALLQQEQYDKQRTVIVNKYDAAEAEKIRKAILGDRTRMPVIPSFPASPVIAATPPLSKSWVVPGWQHGWRWFSNIALTAIVAINTVTIPPELIQALPPHTQQQVTIGLAIIGIIGRFINQSRQRKDYANGA